MFDTNEKPVPSQGPQLKRREALKLMGVGAGAVVVGVTREPATGFVDRVIDGGRSLVADVGEFYGIESDWPFEKPAYNETITQGIADFFDDALYSRDRINVSKIAQEVHRHGLSGDILWVAGDGDSLLNNGLHLSISSGNEPAYLNAPYPADVSINELQGNYPASWIQNKQLENFFRISSGSAVTAKEELPAKEYSLDKFDWHISVGNGGKTETGEFSPQLRLMAKIDFQEKHLSTGKIVPNSREISISFNAGDGFVSGAIGQNPNLPILPENIKDYIIELQSIFQIAHLLGVENIEKWSIDPNVLLENFDKLMENRSNVIETNGSVNVKEGFDELTKLRDGIEDYTFAVQNIMADGDFIGEDGVAFSGGDYDRPEALDYYEIIGEGNDILTMQDVNGNQEKLEALKRFFPDLIYNDNVVNELRNNQVILESISPTVEMELLWEGDNNQSLLSLLECVDQNIGGLLEGFHIHKSYRNSFLSSVGQLEKVNPRKLLGAVRGKITYTQLLDGINPDDIYYLSMQKSVGELSSPSIDHGPTWSSLSPASSKRDSEYKRENVLIRNTAYWNRLVNDVCLSREITLPSKYSGDGSLGISVTMIRRESTREGIEYGASITVTELSSGRKTTFAPYSSDSLDRRQEDALRSIIDFWAAFEKIEKGETAPRA